MGKAGKREYVEVLPLFETFEMKHVLLDLSLALDAHCGQVVEDNGQITVDQGADLTGRLGLHAIDIIHQRVHGAQEVVMLDLGRHVGHGHGVQPAQAPQLACGVAEAVEDHRPHEGICFDLAPPGSHRTSKGAVEV